MGCRWDPASLCRAGAGWGSPSCSRRLRLLEGGTLEVSCRRRQRLFFLQCLPRLQWNSGIGEWQRGLSGSPVAVPVQLMSTPWDNTFEALQFLSLWENTPPSPQVGHRSGLLVVQLWVRMGWPKAPFEGQTKLKLTRGRPATALITFVSLQHPHVLAAQCPPRLER